MTDDSSSSSDRFRAAAAQLARMDGVWQRILATHTRGPDGYCASPLCREPGTGRPFLVHPCPTRVAAQCAEAVHRGTA